MILLKRCRMALLKTFILFLSVLVVKVGYLGASSEGSYYYGYDSYQYQEFGAGVYSLEYTHLISIGNEVSHFTEVIETREPQVQQPSRPKFFVTFSQPANQTEVISKVDIDVDGTKNATGLRKETSFMVYFKFNSHRLTKDQREQIASRVEEFKKKCLSELGKDLTFSAKIKGHACSLGSNVYNLKLSEQRARQVGKFLEGLGFRIEEVKGLGEVSYSEILCLNRYAEVKLSCSR